ncbi:MAG: hypothetical protein JNK04_15950, partial [Myxococcales bacterium]|nr:hypothetical protein [Myxococcales bacterium]
MSIEKRTLVLTHAQVVSLLSMPAAVEAVEGAFAAYSEGRALMPPKVYLSLDAFAGDFRAMPSYLPGRSSGQRALAG